MIPRCRSVNPRRGNRHTRKKKSRKRITNRNRGGNTCAALVSSPKIGKSGASSMCRTCPAAAIRVMCGGARRNTKTCLYSGRPARPGGARRACLRGEYHTRASSDWLTGEGKDGCRGGEMLLLCHVFGHARNRPKLRSQDQTEADE